MRIGMLWFDNSKDSFVEKCNRAITYYENKYGQKPTAIVVHPSTKITEILGVTITTSRSVLVNHFWIGLDNKT